MKLKRWHNIVIFLLTAFITFRLTTRPAPNHPYYAADLNYPLVIAHQGGDNLWPGNTMFAFQNAVNLGVDALEMDLHITSDGILVLIHDETVDRTTDGTGDVEAMTYEELQQFDAGYDWSMDGGATFPFRDQGITVPILEDVFAEFPYMRMTIELKKTNTSMTKPFCDLIRQYGMEDKVLVASFHDERIQEFRKECPEVATSSARQETTVFVLMTKAFLGGYFTPHFFSLQVPQESGGITVMTPSFVKAAHARNLAVEPWTINDEETMRKLIEWGVDGIITDRPDLMLEILGR
ncbi:MAG: glycerophosphodiester phosphodiesterase [Anaerolineales bacterium]|jgi:glycerophosphoryl diester phosphodiesterase|nr:glycerophosphodiester phosphodiesterase [Anaerolineales bacterium]